MTQNAPSGLQLGVANGDSWNIDEAVADVSRPPRAPLVATIEALPQKVRFDLHKAAVIVIDMQNDFCHPQGWMGSLGVDTRPALALAPAINRVTAAARASAVPVIWLNWGVRPDRANLPPITRHPFSDKRSFTGLGDQLPGPKEKGPYGLLAKDSWGAQVIDELRVAAGDVRVDKHRISGFWDTPLDTILRNLGARTLFFAGVNSDHCVLGTLMDASFSGYDTVMIEDCTATTSPAFCHEAAIHNVRFCFGFTTTSEALAGGFKAA